MGGVARSELVAAVSATGAFGYLGMVRERVKGVTPGLIDIDTLSASMGAGDENDPGMTIFVANCLSMALALQLTNAGITVKSIHTTARVHFEERDGGWSIHRIDLDTEASISEMAAAAFEEHAQKAKKNCPISRALSGVDIHLRAKLL